MSVVEDVERVCVVVTTPRLSGQGLGGRGPMTRVQDAPAVRDTLPCFHRSSAFTTPESRKHPVGAATARQEGRGYCTAGGTGLLLRLGGWGYCCGWTELSAQPFPERNVSTNYLLIGERTGCPVRLRPPTAAAMLATPTLCFFHLSPRLSLIVGTIMHCRHFGLCLF